MRVKYIKKQKESTLPFGVQECKEVDYKDIELLKQFITERGKILPRRITGVSAKFQNLIKIAVKQARHMALIPFVAEE
jgi:small subunit ribosomal protein S18